MLLTLQISIVCQWTFIKKKYSWLYWTLVISFLCNVWADFDNIFHQLIRSLLQFKFCIFKAWLYSSGFLFSLIYAKIVSNIWRTCRYNFKIIFCWAWPIARLAVVPKEFILNFQIFCLNFSFAGIRLTKSGSMHWRQNLDSRCNFLLISASNNRYLLIRSIYFFFREVVALELFWVS